jgi:hypothetical protein
MRMRAFIDDHQLVGLNVALCRECHGELSEQILAAYKVLGKFDEGALRPRGRRGGVLRRGRLRGR